MNRWIVRLFGIALLLSAPTFAADAVVNVNQADAVTLARVLDGIGPSKAEAIVAYRTKHGPFKSVDDLTKVAGIGKATVDKNRSRITVAAVPPNAKP